MQKLVTMSQYKYHKIDINIETERKHIVISFSLTLSPFWQMSAQEMHSP